MPTGSDPNRSRLVDANMTRRRTMADEKKDQNANVEAPTDLSRREFVTLSVAAGLAVAAGTASAAEPVAETNVEVKTPDGVCDAAFIHPTSGSQPAVIIWPDA